MATGLKPTLLATLVLLPLFSAHAASVALQRAPVTVTKCEYDADRRANIIHATGKKWKEIIFESYDTKGDLCKRIRTNRNYIAAFTDLEEDGEEPAQAILKAIQPR